MFYFLEMGKTLMLMTIVSAWCADNRLEAIDSIFQGDLIDDNATCINPLDRTLSTLVHCP